MGERHVSVERGPAAAGRPVAAPAEAGGRGIRRLQLVQGGSVVQAGVPERHGGRPTGEGGTLRCHSVVCVAFKDFKIRNQGV